MEKLESIEIHDELNPKIWNNEDELLPDVRDKIIQIVVEFENQSNIPLSIADIQIVGSNASFNYTEHSDLDVHVIVNFSILDISPELAQKIYNLEKSEFNSKYDIKIHGINVELYIQDIKSGIVSNGIYSVCDNQWIKFPKIINNIKPYDCHKQVILWKQKIEQAIDSNNYDTILNMINTLYLIRHNSIAIDGEYGKGNQLFKEIRNLGYISKLKDALNQSISQRMSLENYSKGKLVNSDMS